MSATETSPNAASTHTRLIAGLVSGALIAFGVICWIAANWASFHRFTKLGLVASVLLVAATATVSARARVPALLVATGAVGGLFALIGEIYPSGVDAWQLFFYWAVLTLPFALAARHDALWSLWTIIAVTGIQLWNVQEGAFERGLLNDWAPAWLLSLALALMLSPLPGIARFLGSTRWAFRISAIALAGLVLVTAVANIFGKSELPVLAGFAVLALGIAILSQVKPRDFGLLALWLLALDILLVWRSAELIAPNGPAVEQMLLISLFAIAVVGASVVLLRRLGALSADEPANASDEATTLVTPHAKAHTTWPLAVLSGVGAVIAAIPVVFLFGLLFEKRLQETSGAVIGVVVLAGAIAIMRHARTIGLLQMLGAIAVAIGLSLIAIGLENNVKKDIGFVVAATMAITAALVPIAWTRTVLGFTATVAFLVSVAVRMLPGHMTALSVAVALTAVVAGLANATRALDRPEANRVAAIARAAQPFATGIMAASLVALMLMAGRPFLMASTAILGEFRSAEFARINDSVSLSLSVTLAGVAAALFFLARPAWRTPAAFAVAVAAAAFSLRSPMMGPVLFALACAVLAQARASAVFAALAVLWTVSSAYYALNWTLTQKAWSMVAIGLAIAAVLLVTTHLSLPQASTTSTVPSRQTRWLIALGVGATGALATIAVQGAEDILRHGRPVFMALRPVDPRSLMQGDYMAVAFDTARLPLPATARNREALAIATIDDRNVATLQRLVAPSEARDANDITLRLRTKSRRWFVGSDAWFFEEGQGKSFEAAKFGMFRIGANGRPLLVGLADKNLQRIP